MRISDWSSDVCSSDLPGVFLPRALPGGLAEHLGGWPRQDPAVDGRRRPRARRPPARHAGPGARADDVVDADRKSVGEGKRVSVRVELGGRRIIKKKTTCK